MVSFTKNHPKGSASGNLFSYTLELVCIWDGGDGMASDTQPFQYLDHQLQAEILKR